MQISFKYLEFDILRFHIFKGYNYKLTTLFREEVRRRPSSRKRDSIQLPIIVNGREKFRLYSSSDSGEGF